MNVKKAFFDFVSPEHLYYSSLVFACLTVVTVSMIYVYLYVKKRRYRMKAKVAEQLNDWVSMALMEDELPDLAMPEAIAEYFKKPVIRQFVIDSLIVVRKNVTGNAGTSIVKLYEFLGLKQDSMDKMKHLSWYKKAKGIYELYMMHQVSALNNIMQYANSDNQYIRTEAQTAIVGFAGFDGLEFLNTLTHPMDEWQQLKVLEQLDALDTKEMPHLPLWLQSENEYVVHMALKLTDIYQQYHMHDLVVSCLGSNNPKIRYQAIKALGRIARAGTLQILKEQYPKETLVNKLELLRQIGANGTSEDLPFLEKVLEEGNDSLKKEAGVSMVNIDAGGWKLLQTKAENSEVLTSILRHIKYEKAL